MKFLNYLVFIFLVGFVFAVKSQERPPINVFLSEDYGADSQNWSISQSDNRNIYVANNKGLLEFNGSKWSLYKSPNETILRSVKVIDSLIYTGSHHDFGFWKKDAYGLLNYTSLAQELNIEFLEDEEIWNILSLENWILFQSLDRIHIYNKSNGSYNTVDSTSKISKLFKVDDGLYFQNLNIGLFRIEKGKGVLVSDDSVIKNNTIVSIFNHKESILLQTQDNGFFIFKNNSLTPWEFPAKDLINNVSVFSSIQLKDGSFVLGTISNGIIHLTNNGKLNYHINQSDGLSNNTVLALHQDVDNNLWLGLDNGINCININSPYHIYNDKNGVLGSVYASQIYNNTLYLGTNQGLFYKPKTSKEDFKFIEGTQGQVWCLELLKDKLFCGHHSGTFLIQNNKANLISNIPGTWQIKTIDKTDDLIIQGNYDGLHIIENKGGNWQFKNKLKGFNISSRYFEFLNEREIFVSHEYKGVYRLKLNKGYTEVTDYKIDKDIKKGLYSSLIKYENKLLYASKNGVFKYNTSEDQFLKDSLLSNLLEKNTFSSGKLVSDIQTNKLWSFSSNGINYVASSKISGEKKISSIPFPLGLRKDITGFENITHISDNHYLLGSKTGYILLDLDMIKSHEQEISINQIKVSQLKNNDSIRHVGLDSTAEFENKEHNLKFSYSISEFLKTQKPEYQYRLEGLYNEWSDWTTNGTVFFENLPHGNYTFSVRGRVGNKLSKNTESFSFKIGRPWYYSNIAIAFYVLSFLLFSLLMHNIYKRYYRKQRERLMQKTTREFELKELENKQQLMRFKNDKLREDIENKNRELGVSTMNLIKKNEFLNTLKKELENAEGKNSLNSVIKIIDRNLNNNDDWNLFQEAFNNADKDFLKKIKSLHSSLTSNDLRLCAYLRLNLSSKEIAPLLNISPRSVEVKRYRLRKKMNLEHEVSLSDYILEI